MPTVGRFEIQKNVFLPKLNWIPWMLTRIAHLYRVSRNTLATYVFSISRLPGHLELKSWKFTRSPFNSKFKNVLILIPIIQIEQMSTLRRKNGNKLGLSWAKLSTKLAR